MFTSSSPVTGTFCSSFFRTLFSSSELLSEVGVRGLERSSSFDVGVAAAAVVVVVMLTSRSVLLASRLTLLVLSSNGTILVLVSLSCMF